MLHAKSRGCKFLEHWTQFTFLEADDCREALVGVGDDQQVLFVYLVVGLVDDVEQNRKIENYLKSF